MRYLPETGIFPSWSSCLVHLRSPLSACMSEGASRTDKVFWNLNSSHLLHSLFLRGGERLSTWTDTQLEFLSSCPSTEKPHSIWMRSIRIYIFKKEFPTGPYSAFWIDECVIGRNLACKLWDKWVSLPSMVLIWGGDQTPFVCRWRHNSCVFKLRWADTISDNGKMFHTIIFQVISRLGCVTQTHFRPSVIEQP